MTFSFSSYRSRLLACTIALLAGFLIDRIGVHASHLMREAYEAFCAPGNRFIEFSDSGRSFTSVLLEVVIRALPVFFARSRFILRVNLVLLLLILAGAAYLPFTAGTPPFECVSRNGTYEDRVSGIEDFVYISVPVVLFSYVLVLFDWVCGAVIFLWRVFPWLRPRALLPNGKH